MNPEQGNLLLKIARENIAARLKGKTYEPECPKEFKEELGVFVTLHTKTGDLRGCIGYPEPIKPLIDALLDVSISAALRDPRFPPVRIEELDDLRVEVTVLSKPELIEVDSPEEYPSKIEIGKHGLIVESGFNKGLLLPQVPIEWKWDKEEFLSHTCQKAGLPLDFWKSGDAKIYKFTGEIFSEPTE